MAPRLTLNERASMAERLAAARTVSGLSIREVATDLGLSPHSVHQYERGSFPTRPTVRARLAELYGIPVGQLFVEYERRIDAAREKLAS